MRALLSLVPALGLTGLLVMAPDRSAAPASPAGPGAAHRQAGTSARGQAVTPRPPARDATGGKAGTPNASAGAAVTPVLVRYCVSCHGGATPSGGLRLKGVAEPGAAGAAEPGAAGADAALWSKVAARLRARTMPPAGLPKPSDAELRGALNALDHARARSSGPDGDPAPSTPHEASSPGRVTMRRLNRAQYRNTIKDLVGVDCPEADDFPADDVGYGFDSIGDVLSLSPLLLERYLAATEGVVERGYRKLVPKSPSALEDPQQVARRTLTAFATRAFRRPVTAQEVDRLLKLADVGGKRGAEYDRGMKLALQAVLLSPHFLFLAEPGPGPSAARGLNDWELASRLSYFLWNSMPDDELLGLARKGLLRRPDVLRAQAFRLLKDPRANRLVESFGDQWLQLRRLKSAQPDPQEFPAFNPRLRQDMLTETRRFFGSIVREDRSVLELLDAPYTFLNERLAQLYGIPGVQGAEFRRVALQGTRRGGVVTQASILTLTSNPNRTSPVKRGKWVLEQLFNDAPPPPPPGTPQLSEDRGAATGAPLRDRLARHRRDPACAACHVRMDPIGFSLENYDAIGAWRTRDGRFPIDSSGSFPDGRQIQGAKGLRGLLRDRKDDFARCLTGKLLTYALGRGLEKADSPTVQAISWDLARDGYRFSSLVLGIVRSSAFRMRSAEGTPQ